MPTGKVEVAFEFTPDGKQLIGSGTGRLFINGVIAGERHFERFGGFARRETLDVGEETGSTVSPDYQAPFRFSGTLEKVTVNLK